MGKRGVTNQSPGGALMVVKTCPNCGHKYIVSDIDPEEDCKKCGGKKDVKEHQLQGH